MFCLIRVSFTGCQFYGSLTAVTVLEKIVKTTKNTLALALVLAFAAPGVIHSQQTTTQSTRSGSELVRENFTFVPVNYRALDQNSDEWKNLSRDGIKYRILSTFVEHKNDLDGLNTAMRALGAPLVQSPFPIDENVTDESIVRHGAIIRGNRGGDGTYPTFRLNDVEMILVTGGKRDGIFSFRDKATYFSTSAGIWYGPDGQPGGGDDETYRRGDASDKPINELFLIGLGASFRDPDEIRRRINQSEENRNRAQSIEILSDAGTGEVRFNTVMWFAGRIDFDSLVLSDRSVSNSTVRIQAGATPVHEQFTEARLVLTVPAVPLAAGLLTESGFTAIPRDGVNNLVFNLTNQLILAGEEWSDAVHFSLASVKEATSFAVTQARIIGRGVQSGLVVSGTYTPEEPIIVDWEPLSTRTEITLRINPEGRLVLSARAIPEGRHYVVEYTDDVNQPAGGWRLFGGIGSRVQPIEDQILESSFAPGGAIFRVMPRE